MTSLVEVKNIFEDPEFCESEDKGCRFMDNWGHAYTCILHECKLNVHNKFCVKCKQCKQGKVL